AIRHRDHTASRFMCQRGYGSFNLSAVVCGGFEGGSSSLDRAHVYFVIGCRVRVKDDRGERRLGRISLSTCTNLLPISGSKIVKPVMFPPGRSKLSIRPCATGSVTWVNTIGTVWVSRWTALTEGVVMAKTTSGCKSTSSFASLGNWLTAPPAQRTSTRTLRPSIQPTARIPSTNASNQV